VLADDTNRYLYGMGRIAQQMPNGWQYFLPDALGSVRQLSDAAGALALAQSFDPYGDLLASQGSAATPYGYAGEWGTAGCSICGPGITPLILTSFSNPTRFCYIQGPAKSHFTARLQPTFSGFTRLRRRFLTGAAPDRLPVRNIEIHYLRASRVSAV
jgi:hypothetical protein